MKKIMVCLITAALTLSACGNNEDNNTSGNNTTGETNNTTGGTNNTTGGTNNTTGGTNNTTGGTNNTTNDERARVQIIHASPGAGVVDIFVQGGSAPLVDDLSYRHSTAFFEVPAGVDLTVQVTPGADNSADNPVATVPLGQLDANERYVVMATGVVGDATNPFNLLVIPAAQLQAEADRVGVAVVHASPGAPAVDVVVNNNTTTPAVEGLAYGQFTSAESGAAAYLQLDPSQLGFGGAAVADIRVADTDAFVANFQTPSLVGFAAQRASLLIVATGILGDETNPFGLTVFPARLPESGNEPEPQPGLELGAGARAQIVHDSPDPAASSVDIYVNEELLLPALDFRSATPYLSVPAGVDLDVDIRPAGADVASEPAYSTPAPLELDPGAAAIVVASGVLPGAALEGAVTGSAFTLRALSGQEVGASDQSVYLKVLHNSPDTGEVGVAASGSALIPAFSFGQTNDQGGAYAELPASTSAILQITAPNDASSVVVQTAEAVDLSPFAGLPLLVTASGFSNPANVGALGNAVSLLVVLPDGTTAVLALAPQDI